MKTGYTEAAGYCLLATAQRDFPNSARRRRRQAPHRDRGAQHDLDGGARQREPEAAELGLPRRSTRCACSTTARPIVDAAGLEGHGKPQVRLGAAGAVFVSVPKGEGGKLQTQDRAHRSAGRAARQGPARRHAQGRRRPRGTPVADVPLVVLEPVEQAACFGRAWDAIRLWIKYADARAERRSTWRRARPDHARPTAARHAVLPRTASTCRCARPRSRCSTAASSSATASTRSCRSTAGKLFRFDEHMARLERSLAKLRIADPLDRATSGSSAAAKLIAALPSTAARPTSSSTSR